MDSGIDDEYPDRKSPMYDEISLPFIDASLPPTPKIGRVVNGLDILLGRENSQVGELDFFSKLKMLSLKIYSLKTTFLIKLYPLQITTVKFSGR